ncbi:hydantoinase B/oxoprolinase family protein [Acuticoccus kandeliae]|uniref:hydantoinase B/oxoprolinase family protein n=1 Tax=Acuticoccus kandeliae TaxID=2073160 RepID=UPI000D3E4463|nr:hydantoinase B/oxoprolinase family protein [Acuticoccus kandeliae]
MSVDPFTLTVLQNALIGVAHEMKLMTMRTAYTELWKEQGDMSCCVMDGAGEIVAQDPSGFPVHVTTMPYQLQSLIEGIGRENIKPGDVLMTNDPFLGGTHLPDVLIVRPIFHEGEIVAFLCNRGHWADIGGMGPGSYSPATTELIQEGLVIPPLKLFNENKLDEGLVRFIMRNLRNPSVGLGDMRAQYASCFTGERRFKALIERHGIETIKEGMAEIIHRSEALTRARIATFKDGVYHARDRVDGDGFSSDPQWIDAVVTVKGDQVSVDLTGSSKQSRGGMNCSRASAIAGVQYALKIISDPENPPNAGSYRPIEVITKPGTMCDAVQPGSIVGYGEIVYRVMDATLQAIAPAAPDRVIACGSGSTGTVVIGGRDTRAEAKKPQFLTLELSSGAYGARATKDGINGIRTGAGNAGNVPIEADEMENPILFERYEIVPDTGGAGTFRGGNGFCRVFRVLADQASICICADRHETRPPGFFGGAAGTTSRYVLDPGTEKERVLPSKTSYVPLEEGTKVWLQSAGGGGYGAPEERSAALVERDVRDGYITAEYAARTYGYTG